MKKMSLIIIGLVAVLVSHESQAGSSQKSTRTPASTDTKKKFCESGCSDSRCNVHFGGSAKECVAACVKEASAWHHENGEIQFTFTCARDSIPLKCDHATGREGSQFWLGSLFLFPSPVEVSIRLNLP